MKIGDKMELHKLIEKFDTKERLIIGIDGPSASGKSTLSEQLKNKYDALVIHIDDYFLPKIMKTSERLNEPGGNFHYERFIEEVMSNINNDVIPNNKFNCQNEQLEYFKVMNKRVVVIEGCYSMHRLLREYYDIKIFMDVSKDEQLHRIKKRSGEAMLSRFVNEWIPLEDMYFIKEQIKEKADIIINN